MSMPPAILRPDGTIQALRPQLRRGDAVVTPGFVNAHSHAFQRALRGFVERRAETGTDSFWSWRAHMYQLVERLRPADVEAISAWCFRDMARAGYTAVGEFHYLHHDLGGATSDDPLALSAAVVAAARAVGLHLTLLETAYARPGFTGEATAAQKRFIFKNVESYLEHVDVSRARFAASDGVQVGLAIHSVRAVPRAWLGPIAAYAQAHDLPLHVHACEQRRELEECEAEYGCSPIALLEAEGVLSPRTVIVHGTHVTADDIARLATADAMVCLTPSTERNLGDGLCPVADLRNAGVRLCIGSDSHARLRASSELNAVEEQERLRLEQRCVLVPPGGHLSDGLLPLVHRDGAAALGLSIPTDAGGVLGSLGVPVGIEAACAPGGTEAQARVALDAWLVQGGAPAGVVLNHAGQVIAADDDRLAERDAAIDDAAEAALTWLLAPEVG